MADFSELEYTEPVYKDFEDYIPNDPSYSNCWHLNKIQANLAWDLGTGSSDVVVSIVDDAITINHPDLKDIIWVNPNEIPNNGIDDDGNGFVDDMKGWNFVVIKGLNFISLFFPIVVPFSIVTHFSFTFISNTNSFILCPRLIFSEISKTSTIFSFLRVMLIMLLFFNLKGQKVLIFLSIILLIG